MAEMTPLPTDTFATLVKELEGGRDVREGAVLEAMVVNFDGNRINLDAGLKSPSRIPLEEFRDDNGEIMVKPNDFVKVKVELLDDGRGNTILSHLKYRRELAWDSLTQAHDKGETVKGVIRERVKGGYSVHINGLRAFLPGSLVDLFPTKREDPALIGRTETFFIERLKVDSMSAILNRRMVRERELSGGDLTNLSFGVGSVFTGKVVALVDYPAYTAYIHIGEGIHGRLHRDELSWTRIGNISDALEIDQELQVVVLEINVEDKAITLGAKQLQDDPWVQIEQDYPEGSNIFGKVTLIKEYGAFVEITKGIEGLVHSSEMDWLNHKVKPSDFVSVGEEIEVQMINCNKETRRISLSLKRCRPNPWDEFNVAYRKGTRLQGKISSIDSKYGLFVDLVGGLTGLVHLSNLTHTGSSKDEIVKYTTGQEIDVSLLGVDLEANRISLGIKQLGSDPVETYLAKYRDREPVSATVDKIMEKVARVKFADGVDAILPIGEICEEHIGTIDEKLKVGDTVEVLVINVDKRRVGSTEKRSLVVSIKAKDQVASHEAFRHHRGDANAAVAASQKKTSFGAMFKKTMTDEEGHSDDAGEGEAAGNDGQAEGSED